MKFYIGSSFKNCGVVNYFTKVLTDNGWQKTYNWAENINNNETVEDKIEYSLLELQAIADSDIVIVYLPAGKGTHIEWGIALALNKRIYLCATNEENLRFESSVNFYELPQVKKILGNDADDIINQIIKSERNEE